MSVILSTHPSTPEKSFALDIEAAASQLAVLLAQHFAADNEDELPAQCVLVLDLRKELSLESILARLPDPHTAPAEALPDLASLIRQRLREFCPSLPESQIERMLDSALHGAGIQIGIHVMLEADQNRLEMMSPAERSRRRIFSCPECDEVFIDKQSFFRHCVAHLTEVS